MGLELGADDYVVEAVLAARAHRTGEGGAPTARRVRRMPSPPRPSRPGSRRGHWSSTLRARQASLAGELAHAHRPGVRPARVLCGPAAPRVPARGTARTRVGLHVRRHVDGDGACAPDPREDRVRAQCARPSRRRCGASDTAGIHEPRTMSSSSQCISAGVTVIGLALGTAMLRVLRGRSIGAQVVALTCSTVVAVIAAAYVASRAMFISAHDLERVTRRTDLGRYRRDRGRARARRTHRRGEPRARRRGPQQSVNEDGVEHPLDRRAPNELARLANELALDPGPPGGGRRPATDARSDRGGSSSRGCHTTCAPHSPACARSSRRSRTASSKIPRPSTVTSALSARRSITSPRSSTTCSS